MPNPVVHFAIIGKNAASLRSFYNQAFGWDAPAPIAGSPANYSLIERQEGQGISGGIGQCPDGSYEGHVTFYIGVPNIEDALRKVETLGGTRVSGPDSVPNGPVIGSFRDPESRFIGLVEIPSA